jgi:chromosomal replication initiator protein
VETARRAQGGIETTADAPDQVVGRIRSSLAGRIGDESVARYFDDRVRLAYAPGRLEVRTPTKFMANLLGRRFGAALRDAVSDATGVGQAEVDFSVDITSAGREAGADTDPAREPAPTRAARPASPARSLRHAPTAGRVTTRYRLADYVVGATNRLAYEAACQFASRKEAGGPRACPATLFLHGPCGLGKTHLVHGIAAAFLEQNPGAVVRVVSGETFTNEFIAAVQAGRPAAGGISGLERFRRAYRRVDLLCIDDVHFLTSKAATQSELLHTFDELDLGGARIVLASDEHPHQVKKFSGALVSRFMAGLVTRIAPPDQEMCERLVRTLAQRRGLVLEEGVVRAIVSRIAPLSNGTPSSGQAGKGCAVSVRDIEGLMTRIEAYSRLGDNGTETSMGSPRRVGMLAAQQALGQQWGGEATGTLERRTPVVVSRAGAAGNARTLKLDQITAHVCRVLGVEFDELTGNGRRPQVVLARSLISHLARRLTTLSFPEIARGIGRPTHSTIIAACQRLQAQMDSPTPPTVDLGGTVLTVKELAERMAGELAARGV